MKSIKTLLQRKKKPKMNSIFISVKPNQASQCLKTYYPCLCEAIKVVLVFGRITGLMPISSLEKKRHSSGCKFIVPKLWLAYTYIILIFFVPYVCFMYTERLKCGPDTSSLNMLEWYVMTLGYIITDIESIISLLMGTIMSRNFCALFEHLSRISGCLNEMGILQITINRIIKFLCPCVVSVFVSYTYVAWLRLHVHFDNYYCTLLDQPFAVIIRGITLIFPSVEITIIIMLTALIVSKFNNLQDATALALHVCTATGNTLSLGQIAETHQSIHKSISELNKYFGIQMLMGITSSLYTTIYYLYRICTARDTNKYSNTHEKIHYLLSLLYRSFKLIIYIILGHQISTSSLKPLEALQTSSIIYLPTCIQQQVSTLILLWKGKKATLSGLGVVNIGPWLLAPIVGNVVTYLLVALQFEHREDNDVLVNNTNYLEYF